MATDEVDAYLRSGRTCRVGTVGADGGPRVSPLWFVSDGEAVWLNSGAKSQRWTNMVRDPRVSVVVDGDDEYMELHGVEVVGDAELSARCPARVPTIEQNNRPDRARARHLAAQICRS